MCIRDRLIVVSHDREFLDGLTEKIYEIRDGRIKQYIGGIYDFLHKRKIENLAELNRAGKKIIVPEENKIRTNKLEYERKKEYERQVRKIERQIHLSEEHVSWLEKELEKLHNRMNGQGVVNDKEVFKTYEKTSEMLSSEMQKWERLNLELEVLKNKS